MNQPLTLGLAAGAGLLLAQSGAHAGIATFTDNSSMMGDVTNSASFNALTNGQSLFGYEEDGLRISVGRSYFSWDAPGFDGSEMFYANTGSLEQVEITLSSGEDFNDLEMQIASGWNPDAIGTEYIWMQLYDDGNLVGEFDLNIESGSYLGIGSGGFDRVLIGSYASEAIRDSRNPIARNAIAIDNLSAGTFVPAPGAAVLLAVGGIVGSRRRR